MEHPTDPLVSLQRVSVEHIIPDEQQEELHRFRTYFHYVRSISAFLKEQSNAARFTQLVACPQFLSLRAGRCPDPGRVRQLLRSAWSTEIQLTLAARQEDLISYSNHWAPVQLYYATYLALRALLLASNQNVSHDHSATLRAIAEMIKSRPALFPQPWKTLCVGEPRGPTLRYLHLPAGATVNPISTLTNPDFTSFWDFYGLFLRTTRQRQGDLAVAEWKRSNRRKRIPAAMRTRVVMNIPPTSFFNALYRLRLRSNYADAESFLITLENTYETKEFHKSLRRISWATLLILELLIARCIEKNQFESWVEEFSECDRVGLGAELVRRRWATLRQLW